MPDESYVKSCNRKLYRAAAWYSAEINDKTEPFYEPLSLIDYLATTSIFNIPCTLKPVY